MSNLKNVVVYYYGCYLGIIVSCPLDVDLRQILNAYAEKFGYTREELTANYVGYDDVVTFSSLGIQ